MILKGNLHAHGMKLIGYMLSAEKGEAAEFVAMRGFDYFHHDPEVAADIMQGMAAENSSSPKPFFHGHLRTDPNERLTDAQWMEAIDRMERRAGFSDQPRFVTQHLNPETGERHFHVAWFRFDPERGGVIDPGLYKLKFKEEARRIEHDFALRELGNDRRPHDLARAGTRNELEESRRLGTDIRAIRSTILDCFEKSDSGKALKAALDERGMQLANGDRRDCFVVIDAAGGQHALNKKLTGLTLAETRARLADLDRAQLPSVDRAKEMQAARAAEIEQRRAAAGRRDEIGPDRAAAAAQEQGKHGRAADGAAQGTTRSAGPQSAPPPEIKPLGKTAGEIRTAWGITRHRGVDAFAEEIAKRGLILVHVSREESYASHRASAFAKAVERQNRALEEGFAVVDRRGNVTRIDQRTTGDQWEEIQKRLGGIDRTELMTVDEAKAAQRDANRAEFRAKKEAEGAQERINQPIGKSAGDIRREETAEAWRMDRAESALRRGDGAVGPGQQVAKDQGVRSPGGIASGIADGAWRLFGAVASFVEGLFSPPKPPSTDQAERMQRAAEERAATNARAAEDAQHKELLDQLARDRRRREDDELTQRLSEQLRRDLERPDRDSDYSRGRERDR